MTATLATAETYKGYEMPPFEVVAVRETYEIRDYAPHLLATVRLEGDLGRTASQGFRTLAGYIFGGNDAGEKIAMTVPVSQVPTGDGYEISFMLPSARQIEALPVPDATSIRFSETKPERLAVRQFTGHSTGAGLRRRAAELRDILERDGVTILAGPRYAYYDDPFTLPWKRRNEVAYVIAR